MKNKITLSILLIYVSLPVIASAYWIDVKGSGKINEPVTIELFYGSMDDHGVRHRDTGKELQLSGDFQFNIINSKNQSQTLEFKLHKDCWLATFTPRESGQYRIIGLNDKHPVIDRSAIEGKNVLPIDYITAIYNVGKNINADLKPLQKLDLILLEQDGKLIIKAFLDGKTSNSNTKIRIFNPENWEKELILNNNGETYFYPTMKGLYIIRQDWNEKISGTKQQLEYSSIRHRCNYFMIW